VDITLVLKYYITIKAYLINNTQKKCKIITSVQAECDSMEMSLSTCVCVLVTACFYSTIAFLDGKKDQCDSLRDSPLNTY